MNSRPATERRAAAALGATALMSAGAVLLTPGPAWASVLLFAAALLVLLRPAVADPLAAALARVRIAPLPRVALATAAVALWVGVAVGVLGATRYHSDSVVAAHAAAERVLAGRDPYVGSDLVADLARFGLPETYATPLDDGTRSRAFQYPALAALLPAPFVAAGLADVRYLYLAEVLAIFALVLRAAGPARRAVALACCVGNVVVLQQFVDAGVDPAWALFVVAAWTLRGRRATSAVLLGLALAARQPAWLVAPFVLAWAWRERGPADAATRALIALGLALAIHAPFLAAAPAEVVRGVTGPALLPLEPWGVGPAKLLADSGVAAPRIAFLAAAGTAYLGALWAFATGRLRSALSLPLMPLWVSWRALQSYFAFLPLFALVEDNAADAR